MILVQVHVDNRNSQENLLELDYVLLDFLYFEHESFWHVYLSSVLGQWLVYNQIRFYVFM